MGPTFVSKFEKEIKIYTKLLPDSHLVYFMIWEIYFDVGESYVFIEEDLGLNSYQKVGNIRNSAL